MQVRLLAKLEQELEQGDVETFAAAARDIAEAFGSVAAIRHRRSRRCR